MHSRRMGPFWIKQINVRSPFHFPQPLTPLQACTFPQRSIPCSFPNTVTHVVVYSALLLKMENSPVTGHSPSPWDLAGPTILLPSLLLESLGESLAQILLHLGCQTKSRHFHCLTLPSKPPTFLPDHPEFVFHNQKKA